MKKILSKLTILTVLIVLCTNTLLVACGSKPPADSVETPSESESCEESTPPQEDTSVENYIVKNGVANYCIVVPEESSVSMTYAKNQLKDYIYKVTGANLSMYSDADTIPTKYHYISLGKTTYLAKENFGFDYNLNGDGFYIYTSDENIYIEAALERGILYGVYEFLERFAGIRFLTEEYEYIPSKKDIKCGNLTICEVPDFKERDAFCAISSGSPFFSKMRFLDPYGYSAEKYGESYHTYWNSVGHTTLTQYLPKAMYYADHPNWYSDSGKDVDPTSGLDENDQYTGDVNSGIHAMIEVLKDQIINNPTQQYFFVGQEDNGSCDCAGFKASLARNGNSQTAVWMIYINTIAKEIEKWVNENYPEREIYIGTFSYQWTKDAPVKWVDGEVVPINDKVVANDNVFVMIAPIEACYYHSFDDESCETNVLYAYNRINNWSKICKSFIVWDYQTNYFNYLNWFPHYSSMRENLKTYIKYGFWRIQQQNSTGEMAYYQNKLDVYVTSKLMWDTDRSVNELVSEFNKYYFGQAGECIDKMYDLLNTCYTINTNGTGCVSVYDTASAASLSYNSYPKAALEKILGYVREGMEIINGSSTLSQEEKDEYIDHLARVIIQPMSMILNNYSVYYEEDTKYEFAKEFCAWGDKIGLKKYSEYQTWSDYKATLGF